MVISALIDIWAAFKEFGEQAVYCAAWASGIYLFILLAIYLYNLIHDKKHGLMRQVVLPTCLFVVFAIYFSYLIAITLSGREAGSRVGQINMTLFSTLFVYGKVNLAAIENIVLFIPFGILVPFLWKFFRKWWNLVLGSFIMSLIIEIVQLITARGFCELDDVVMNTMGAFLGYLIFLLFYFSIMSLEHRIKHGSIAEFYSSTDNRIDNYTLFAIQLLPVIMILLMIFRFSSDDGATSSNLSLFASQKVVYVLNSVFHLGLSEMGMSLSVLAWEPVVRKLAHFAEYSMLTFFTFVFMYCRKLKWYVSYIVTFAFGLIVAILDEYNQTTVSGRTGAGRDVFIDMCGTTTVLVLIALNIGLRLMYKKYKGE